MKYLDYLMLIRFCGTERNVYRLPCIQIKQSMEMSKIKTRKGKERKQNVLVS